MPLRSWPDRGKRLAAGRSSPTEPLAAYESLPTSAVARLAAAETDAELAASLLALPPVERQAVALHDPRFRRPTLAKLLLLQAESELFDPAEDPRSTAEAAAAVASAVSQAAGGESWQAAALAHWLLGKAQLAAREWHLAERSFRGMSAVLPDSGPSEERALAAVGRAQLAADRCDIDGATDQFLEAAYGFALLGSAQSTAACQAELGLFLLDAGDLINARLSLGVAIAFLDAAAAPSLAARLHLALAEVATALNERPSIASEELARAQALYPLAPDGAAGPEALERRWREGRIAAAACDGARAAGLLDEVRRELLLRGGLPEAARCTFDQLLLRIDTGDSSDVGDLTGALAHAFPGQGEGWAEEMARLARLAADQPEAVCTLLGAAAPAAAGGLPRARTAAAPESRALADRSRAAPTRGARGPDSAPAWGSEPDAGECPGGPRLMPVADPAGGRSESAAGPRRRDAATAAPPLVQVAAGLTRRAARGAAAGAAPAEGFVG